MNERNELRRTAALLAALFVAYAGALVWQAWRTGVTFDEGALLVTGYMYWGGEDVLKPADSPPLVHLLSGWVPRLFHIPVRRNTRAWAIQSSFDIGQQVLSDMDAGRAHRLIFLARLPLCLFPLGICWIAWRWGRRSFGAGAAVWLVVAVMLEPSLLAHGALIKSDVPAAFGLLWLSYRLCRFWQEPDGRRVLWLALSLAIALLTKFTLLVVFPLTLLAVVARYASRREFKAAAAVTAGLAASTWTAVAAAYQFKVAQLDAPIFRELAEEASWPPELTGFLNRIRFLPLPPRLLQGMYFVAHATVTPPPSYMLGGRIEGLKPLYFPFALAIKYPIPLQLLLAGGLVSLGMRLRRGQTSSRDFFLWAPAILFFVLPLYARVYLGFRYIFPCLPLFVLAGGDGVRYLHSRRAGRWILAAGITWLLIGAIRIYPQGISYFNEWAGGPQRGWKYLADSNTDWGQNLPELAQYVREERPGKIKLAYFGRDPIEHYLGPDQFETVHTPFCRACVKEKILTPEPGVYAVSVNNLLGYFFDPEYRDYFRLFRSREPDAKAGYSIFIYRVPGSTASPGKAWRGVPVGAEAPARRPAVTIPHIAHTAGFETSLLVSNLSGASAEMEIQFFGDRGEPLPFSICPESGERLPEVDRIAGTVAAGALAIVSTCSPGPSHSGYARVAATPPDAVRVTTIVRQHSPGEPAFFAAIPQGTRIEDGSFLFFRNTSGLSTSLALVNDAAVRQTVTIIARDAAGRELARAPIPLGAGEHLAFVLADRIPQTAERFGQLEFRSTHPAGIAAIGLLFQDSGAFTALLPLRINR